MNLKTAYVFLIFTFAFFNARAQVSVPKLDFKSFDISDGLTSNEVNSISEDRDGFLWFATDDGISRFDGYDFATFRSSISRPDYFESNTIRSIDILGDNIVLMSPKGAEFLNRRSQTISTPDLKEAAESQLKSAVFLNDHMLLLGGSSGLFLLNTMTEEISRMTVADSNGQNILTYIRTIYKDSSSNIWMGTWENGVFCMPSGSANVIHPDVEGLPERLFVTGFAEIGGKLYISTWSDGIYILAGDGGGYSARHVDTAPMGWTITYSIAADSHGLLWAGSPSGTFILSPKGSSLTEVTFESPEDKSRLDQIKESKAVFCDSDGNIWVSRYGNGVVAVSRKSNAVSKVDFNGMGFPFNEVGSIFKFGSGPIWLGIRGKGLIKYHEENGGFLEEDSFLREINVAANSITGFCDMPNRKKILMSTRYDGLFLADYDRTYSITGLQHFDTGYGTIRNNFTNCLCKANVNNFWVGTNKGLVLMRVRDDAFSLFEPEDLNKAIGYCTVSSLCQGRNGRLWIGTSDHGLYRVRYDFVNMRITDCRHYSKAGKDFTDDKIQCIFQDSRSSLWVGTKGGGLYRFDQDSETFRLADKVNLFPSYEICSIAEDRKGELWISTANGFFCFSQDEEVKAVFPGTFFLPGASWTDGETMIFGGYNGLTICDVDAAVKGFDIKAPKITRITINNGEVSDLADMPPFTDKLTVSHRQRNISLTFSSPGLEDEKQIRYAYRLAKPDKEWNYVSPTNRTVTYSNLAPGRYTFSVMASSRPGIWSSHTTLAIKVKVAPWLTWWALILYAIFITSICLYIKKMKNKQSELTRNLEEFRKELAEQTAPNLSTDLDKIFIQNLVSIIEHHLSDADFNIEAFNDEMHMSGSTLYRKVKAITGMSPKEYVRSIRFKYACKFLLEKSSNVSEVAYMVGFSNAKYFSLSFKKEFGLTPSQYIKKHK